MLPAPMLNSMESTVYRYLQSEVEPNENQIVQELKRICEQDSLKMLFLPASPNAHTVFTNTDGIHKAVLYSNAWTSPHRWKRGEGLPLPS